MNSVELWTLGGPSIAVVTPGQQVDFTTALPPGGTVVVARIDGAELTDGNDVFVSFYRELRFPEWFGWNWDALSDCLRDLDWLAADRFLVIVDRADQALSSGPEERTLLIKVLRRAVHFWASALNDCSAPVAFKVVFICPREAAASLRDEIAAA